MGKVKGKVKSKKKKPTPMPIDFLDRGKLSGFRKYMEARPGYFKEIFGNLSIEEAFQSTKKAAQIFHDDVEVSMQMTQPRVARTMARIS